MEFFFQGWEERTYANVIHLLKTKLSNSDKDQLLVPPAADKNIGDFAQLWKLLCTAFDRVTGGKFSVSLKLDKTRSTSRSDFSAGCAFAMTKVAKNVANYVALNFRHFV